MEEGKKREEEEEEDGDSFSLLKRKKIIYARGKIFFIEEDDAEEEEEEEGQSLSRVAVCYMFWSFCLLFNKTTLSFCDGASTLALLKRRHNDQELKHSSNRTKHPGMTFLCYASLRLQLSVCRTARHMPCTQYHDSISKSGVLVQTTCIHLERARVEQPPQARSTR